MKRKKIIAFAVGAITAVSLILGGVIYSRLPHVREVKIKPGKMISKSMRAPFDLHNILTGRDHQVDFICFLGTIKDMKEYSVSWIDDNGERWDDYSESLLTVEIEKIYAGSDPTDSGEITILYPYSLSMTEDDSVSLKTGTTYVFTDCWVINDRYYEYGAVQHPSMIWKNDPMLKRADAITSAAWSMICPVEHGNVFVYHEYIAEDSSAYSKILPPGAVKTDLLTSPYALNGDYVAMKLEDFEEYYISLLDEAGSR